MNAATAAEAGPAAASTPATARRGHEDPRVVAAILVTMLLWSSAFVAIRSARLHYAPAPMALGRLLVACVALSALMAARRAQRPSRADLLPIAVFGVLWLGVYGVALNASERLIDAGTAAMLVNVAPIMIAVAATIVLRERLTRPLLAGLVVAFAGAVVIGIGSGSHHGGIDGALLCVLAAAAYTAAVIVQKPLLARVSPLAVTWGASIAGVIVCLPFAPGLVGEVGRAPASATLLIVYLGIGPTAIGFTTWAYALSHSTMARQGATTYLVPPLTIAISWLTLGEVPGLIALLGGALCLAGVALTRRRARV